MPRPLRVHVEGALYYVTSRAAEGAALFRDDQDYAAYLEFLRQARAQGGMRVYAFLFLPDQLHLCLEPTGDTTVSAFMQAVNSRYTKHVAKKYGPTSHVFQERFRSVILEKAPNLLRLTGYLHAYPAKRGMGTDMRTYRWSSYCGYLAPGTAVNGLSLAAETAEVLGQLSRECPATGYDAYIESLPLSAWQQVQDDLARRVVGSAGFAAAVEARSRAAASRPDAHAEDVPRIVEVAMPKTQVISALARVITRSTSSQLVAATLLAVAVVSGAAVARYAETFAVLKQAVRALASERGATRNTTADGPAAGAGMTLASFTAPIRLGGTEWQTELRPVNGANGAIRDRLVFQNERVASDALSAEGFGSSRYSMADDSDGTVRWEAVQVDPSGSVVHWQGRSDGRTMHGSMTRQAPGQAAAQYNFVGIARPGARTREI